MIYIGIDVAKDKHDCFITNSEGEVLFNAFTIPNNADGFHDLFQKISSLFFDFFNAVVICSRMSFVILCLYFFVRLIYSLFRTAFLSLKKYPMKPAGSREPG